MKKGTLCFIILVTISVVFAVASCVSNRLNTARRPAREARALSVGYDLINTTNSAMLVGADSDFMADLAGILGWPTWREIDRSPPPDRRAVVRLILTNDQGQALHMQLQDEFPSGQLRLLSYQKITGPGSAANRSQPSRLPPNKSLQPTAAVPASSD
jgi:hypothetical protein